MAKKISLIVVNYKADEHVRRLQRALETETDIELITVDHSDGGRGYSEGLNTGARHARGEILVFANPDLEFEPTALRKLVHILEDHPEFGVVGPQIRRPSGEGEITCSAIPDPLMALIVWSPLQRWPVLSWWSKAYRLHGFTHTYSRVVPSLNGSIFAMRAQTYEALGGFDDSYFLYFEEFVLGKRMKELGLKLWFNAETPVTHLGAVSTQQSSETLGHFLRSRRRYLRQWGIFGTGVAWILERLERRPHKLRSEASLTVAMLVREGDAPQKETIALLQHRNISVLLVIDGESPTWTKLARKHNWTILVEPMQNFASSRNEALEHINTEWTVFIDSDEILTQSWWDELSQFVQDWRVEAVYTKRHDLFHGQILQHGEVGAQRLLRACRTSLGRRRWTRPVHEVWQPPALSTRTLQAPLLHAAHQDLHDFMETIQHYLVTESTMSTAAEPLWKLFLFPPSKFLQNYFWRGGWRDGFGGFVYAFMMSFYSLAKRVTLYESSQK